MSEKDDSVDSKIVDEIIHYLKLNNAGHIDRDNVVDVLIKYIEKEDDDEGDELKDMKEKVRRIISDLEDLV